MKEIYTTLFNLIIGRKYPPDTQLKEKVLAEEFNLSRTPVRETLRQLEQDGLVQIIPNRGARVNAFTVDDVEEIYEIRESLELLALETSAPSLSIHGLMEIRTLIQANAQSNDFMKHEEDDAKLHRYFIEASEKRRLIAMLNQLFHLIQHFRQLGFKDPEVRSRATKEHLELIDTMCFRDVKAAKEILSRHIKNSKINAVSHLVRGG